ncbi:hypothetical protein [Histidinibacterium aquaticum]|uniref:Uncharacterized protein n=1 Tax=Histidinibacterium aquaticum TaxID=2613962 RepID=A0A5J5GCR3_9RHOB|nr:hypothetical protein [Histidinibacterium aquaticum]KAA9005945.1 hypothetical protein F3S47_15415 [Histidinibacterium aquaticum]
MGRRPAPPKLSEAFLNRQRDEYYWPLEAYNSKSIYLLGASKEGEIPDEMASFEILQAIATLYSEHGFTNEAIMEHHPIQQWREEGVMIPVPVLNMLVNAWAKYLEGPSGMTMGEAFNLEGHGQGKKPKRERLQNILRERQLARAAIAAYLGAGASDAGGISKSEAHAIVAERFNVSEDTVKRAHKKWEAHEMERLRVAGAFSENEDDDLGA